MAITQITGAGTFANNLGLTTKLVAHIGSGRLYSATGVNLHDTTTMYMLVWDTDLDLDEESPCPRPILSMKVLPGETVSLDYAGGRPFNLGIQVAFSIDIIAYHPPAGAELGLIDVCYEKLT